MKSNINVVSNIYIRKPESITGRTDDLNKDLDFVKQVSGREALQQVAAQMFGMTSRIKLSPVQVEELRQSTPCTYAKHSPGEVPFGKVIKDGELFYESRCEVKNCPKYASCSRMKYDRTSVISTDYLDDTDLIEDIDWGDIFGESIIEEEERKSLNEIPAEEVIDIQGISSDIHEFQPISSEQAIPEIIQSSIDGHILVNAGPGSGKTYTAIQRLLYVLNVIPAEECDRILVLCYTRAAVGEIKTRIEKGISEKTLPYEAGSISICTLDSFATSYLLTVDSLKDDLIKYDYNDRIRLFNSHIKAEDFEDFKYCIIDEIQDLVNDRANMVIKLISALKCGYLLLGDKCQAIYDYDCVGQNSINSTQFYELLKETLPDDTQRFEIIGNKRQSEDLNARSELLRHELLNYNYATIVESFADSLKNISTSCWSAEDFNDANIRQSTAILCRNNGEAEYTSWLLHQHGVPHKLVRSNTQGVYLHRCIADALWDFANDIIAKPAFMDRLRVRCGFNDQTASELFDSICEVLYQDNRDFFEIDKLTQYCSTYSDLPDDITNDDNDMLIVSTIHKAKGREFDKVYLLGYDYDTKTDKYHPNTEEERVLYVAETRPKKEIEILRKRNKYNWFFRKSEQNRWIRTAFNCRTFRSFCAGIATGISGDVDESSFVSGQYQNALKKQYYISTSVHKGDAILLKLAGGEYDIVHKGTVIGKMSGQYISQLTNKFNDGRRYIYELPSMISDLFVKDVYTFVSHKDYENVPRQFRSRRIWLAVEITGFGKTTWQEN